MALRFQRRISLVPGVRMNLSKSGVGFSVGPRGAAISVGARGVHRHIGIPGTGIAFRDQLSGPRGRSGGAPVASAGAPAGEVLVRLEEDGTVSFHLEDGAPVPPALQRAARRDHGDRLRARLAEAAEERNATLEACLSIHLETPAPAYRPLVHAEPEPERPPAPMPRAVGLWDRLLLRRGRIEAANAAARAHHAEAMVAWEAAMAEHAAAGARIAALNDAVRAGGHDAVAAAMAERLSAVAWARPTEVSFDFGADTATLALDVDLPTIEEIPDTRWVVAGRGLALRGQKRSDAQKRRDFAYLAHASLFRIAGEAFSSLPTLRVVTLSGYTQRPDPATGATVDVYILSVRIPRAEWEEVRFDRLDAVDVVEALDRFALVRRRARNGELQQIEPHSADPA